MLKDLPKESGTENEVTPGAVRVLFSTWRIRGEKASQDGISHKVLHTLPQDITNQPSINCNMWCMFEGLYALEAK